MKILADTEKLNTMIAQKGMNANILSKQIGMPFTTHYRIFRGTHSVSPQNAKAIADGLGVPFETLFRVGVKKP